MSFFVIFIIVVAAMVVSCGLVVVWSFIFHTQKYRAMERFYKTRAMQHKET